MIYTRRFQPETALCRVGIAAVEKACHAPAVQAWLLLMRLVLRYASERVIGTMLIWYAIPTAVWASSSS